MKRLSRHEKPSTIKNENGGKISNPLGISLNQHVLPEKFIRQWSTDGNFVAVYENETKEIKPLSPGNPYFCVMRLWDQWTEAEMLKTNEDNFWKQIDLIKSGNDITHPGHITEFYVMLCVRIFFANKERPNYPSDFVTSSLEPTKLELEQNEMDMLGSGVSHIITGTTSPSSQHIARQTIKILLSSTFLRLRESMNREPWIILNTAKENFVLSDAFYNNYQQGFHVLPISPTQALIPQSLSIELRANNCLSDEYINIMMVRNSLNYHIKLSEFN